MTHVFRIPYHLRLNVFNFKATNVLYVSDIPSTDTELETTGTGHYFCW